MNNNTYNHHCDVCGAKASINGGRKICNFCKFEKIIDQETDKTNTTLIEADDINLFFKQKYSEMNHGETFELIVPVSRFYKKPKPIEGQINFFKSKNIMFLLEQHGFQMVSRVSRFSCSLSLIVRKV